MPNQRPISSAPFWVGLGAVVVAAVFVLGCGTDERATGYTIHNDQEVDIRLTYLVGDAETALPTQLGGDVIASHEVEAIDLGTGSCETPTTVIARNASTGIEIVRLTDRICPGAETELSAWMSH